MTLLLFSLISSTFLMHAARGRTFQMLACFDTKCPVISGESDKIVRYVDCEHTISRATFCEKDRQLCVNNPMSGKGSCLDKVLSEQTTPAGPFSLVTPEKELILKISVPLVSIFILSCVILLWRYTGHVTYWYNSSTNRVSPLFS